MGGAGHSPQALIVIYPPLYIVISGGAVSQRRMPRALMYRVRVTAAVSLRKEPGRHY